MENILKHSLMVWAAIATVIPFTTGGYLPRNRKDILMTDRQKRDVAITDRHSQFWRQKVGAPEFLNGTNTTVMTSVGQTAYLHCHIDSLGDRAVSWIRSRDLTILTIGLIRYTRDVRFTAIHAENSPFWGLKIINPQLEDSGSYECQVSYHDDVEKKLKMPFTLKVLESRALIAGNSKELYMKEGSRVVLECGVEEIPGPPAYIYWYRDQDVINYSSSQGITVSLSTDQDAVTSKLVIQAATPTDSGNYTCAPANAQKDSVILNIIKGEKGVPLLQEPSSSAQTFLMMSTHVLVACLMSVDLLS